MKDHAYSLHLCNADLAKIYDKKKNITVLLRLHHSANEEDHFCGGEFVKDSLLTFLTEQSIEILK